MRIIYRGVYAGFPAAALHTGDLAHATDLLALFISDGTNWVPYYDYPDYQGEKQGIRTVDDVSAQYGRRRIVAANAIGGYGTVDTTNLLVVPGLTIYITELTLYCYASAAADADNNQIAIASLFEASGIPVPLGWIGGNGGGTMTFRTPRRFVAGEVIRVVAAVYANHNCNAPALAIGYDEY